MELEDNVDVELWGMGGRERVVIPWERRKAGYGRKREGVIPRESEKRGMRVSKRE